MNYQDVKTFQELAEEIKKHIDSHRIPCTDVLRGEGVMYVNAKELSTTDARLAFVRLKNKFGVELPVPDDLIELLDSCGDADRKVQDKSALKEPAEAGQDATPAKIINIENFKGVLGDVRAENVQTGDHASIYKQRKVEKKGIVKKLLRIVGFLAALLTILHYFGWLGAIKALFTK